MPNDKANSKNHSVFLRRLSAKLFLYVFLGLRLFMPPAEAQSPDCDRLRAEIAAIDSGSSRPNAYTAAGQRQQAEIARTAAYAQSLGCDRGGFSFFGGAAPPQCNGLNARIRAMQANLSQLQTMAGRVGGGAQRQDLVARFNAYCRPQPRGFFDSLFGGSSNSPPPAEISPSDAPPAEEDQTARGGSQAICVRSCDGGFFPLNYSARHGSLDSLQDLCNALCPNAEVSLYTRSPENEVGTAVSADGTPYRDLPNAFKFQKSFDPACTCKAKGESWVQALTESDAEHVLGQERKGDIIVTPQQSLEMSKPKADLSGRAKGLPTDANQTAASKLLASPAQDALSAKSNVNKASASPADSSGFQEITGPDGVKRRVRIVGPTP